MDINEATALLGSQLCNFDWFYGVEQGGKNKIIVYTTHQNLDVYNTIPNKVEDYNVCVHFAVAKQANHFTKDLDQNIEYSIESLNDELSHLKRLCDKDTLEDVFYEIHDKNNAITNMSPSFPYVRKTMERLYEQYGFDVICDELGL